MIVAIQWGYWAVSLLLFLIAITQGIVLFRFISQQSNTLDQLLTAIESQDFTFQTPQTLLGDHWRSRLENILIKWQGNRENTHHQEIFLNTVIAHIPIAVIAFDANKTITLYNHFAQKLWGMHKPTSLDRLEKQSPDFFEATQKIPIRQKVKIPTIIRDQKFELLVVRSVIKHSHSTTTLLTIENITRELDENEMAAWRDLTRVLTHEIMNSITPIVSLANTGANITQDLLNDTSTSSPHFSDLFDVDDALNTINQRGLSLTEFVSHYRTFIEAESPRKTRFKLAPLCQHIITLLSIEASRKGIHLTLTTAEENIYVYADEKQLEQVLINLILNAIDAYGEGVTGQNATIKIRLSYSHTQVEIQVSDAGQGITEDDLNKIFVPFFTTKRKGSGVGMSLSRQIIHAHNGHIYVKSKRHQGTLVTIGIPHQTTSP